MNISTGRARAGAVRRMLGGVVLLGTLLVAVCGCGIRIPEDPRGSLDHITDGTLRAGASITPGLVEGTEDAAPRGPLVDLVDGFAAEQQATTEWTVGSEETLVSMLEDGELDVVVGGMTDGTPWSERAGVTRGYRGVDGADGRTLVMLVPLGENRLLSALEEYLDREVGS